MSFIQVTKEEFNTHAQQVSERSFMQTEEMAKLLEKRGFSISYGGELWTNSLKCGSSK